MVRNDGMAQVFGRIGLRRFIGFGNGSGRRKRIVGGSGVENHGRND